MELSVDEIAQRTAGTVIGDGSKIVTGLAGLREASAGDLSFFGDPKYAEHFTSTKASAVFVRQDCGEHAAAALIQVGEPYAAFVQMLAVLESEVLIHPEGIDPRATVMDGATVDETAAVGANAVVETGAHIKANAVVYSGAYIGRDATIGEGTVIFPNVVVRERCTLGARCIVHPNVTIGGDGFGFVNLAGIQHKIPQVGNVVIGDDVEIGANTSIDRGTAGSTRIGNGTKIDSQVQIGHNVQIGESCAISGCTGIAGSAVLGDRITVGGDSGIGGHLEIGDDAVLGGRTGVVRSIPAGAVVSGFPAAPHDQVSKFMVSQLRLPEALRRIRQLEKRLEELEK